MGGPSTQTGGRLFLLIRGVLLGLVRICVLLLFQKPVKRLRSPEVRHEATEMPKRSRKQDRKLGMVTSCAPQTKTKTKSSETAGKPASKPMSTNPINIPLKDFSPEVRKLLIQGIVKGGKAIVVKRKKDKDEESKEKSELVQSRSVNK